jgi:transposase
VSKRYSDEFKESVIKKMMPPNPKSISQLRSETGVSDVTLYKWRKSYRNKGVVVPGDKSKPEKWSAGDKLAVVIETASFNEFQLSEYCRSKGLYKEQIIQWKLEALSGYEKSTQVKKSQSQHRRDDKEKIKKLERELNRKEKALAETAALLVLSKKWEAIWGENEED